MEARNPDAASVIRPLPGGLAPALYAHVPFCASKCEYCDFYSLSGWDAELVSLVIERELEELEVLANAVEAEGFDTLYVGGGTPSAIPRKTLDAFLTKLGARTGGKVREFTVEANPESMDRDFLSIMENAGADRISLGIQTWNERWLSALGRISSARKNEAALDLLGSAWKGKISIDLMYGFPGQTVPEAVRDLETLLAFRPGHVSLYALTVEEETPLSRRIEDGRSDDIDSDAQEDLRDELDGMLLGAGYRNYEISNYALPGNECLHNESYWELRPYIGIGPAAVSTLPAREPAVAARLTGKRDASAFARAEFKKAGRAISENIEVELIGRRDFLLDYLLMGLRTAKGIDENAFSSIFGEDLREIVPRSAKRHSGLFERVPGRFALTDRGRRLLNIVLVDIFREIEPGEAPRTCIWPFPAG